MKTIEIPFMPEPDKILYDVQEYIWDCDYPEIYEVDGSQMTIYIGSDKSIWYCIDSADYSLDSFGTVLFENENDAWSAVKAHQKSKG